MDNLKQIPPDTLPQSSNTAAEDAARQQQEEQMKRDLMATILDTAARERLSRISLVSPERSKKIEDLLTRMATSGQLRGRVTDSQLVDLLEQLEGVQSQKSKTGTISYQRRRDPDDDFDI